MSGPRSGCVGGVGPGRWWCLALAVVAVLAGCTPGGAKALMTGERLLREGRPEQAVEPLRRAVVLLSTNSMACAQAWNYLGLAYHYSGRPVQADQAYQRALAKDFNLFAARFNRGCLLLEQNNLPGAIGELTTYTAHQPAQVRGWLKLGTAQLRARQLDAAERTFLQALKLTTTPAEAAEAFNAIGVSQVSRRRPREAFAFFETALKRQTNYAPAVLNQAVVAQLHLRDLPLALEKYKTCLSLTSEDSTRRALEALVRQLEADLRARATPSTSLVTPITVASNLALRLQADRRATTGEPPAQLARTGAAVPVSPPKLPPSAPVAQTSPPPAGPVSPPLASRSLVGTGAPPVVVAQTQLPPVEVVTLPAEPEVKPAQDVALGSRPSVVETSRPPSVAPEPIVVPAQPPEARSAQAQPPLRSLPKPKPEKRSFLQTINPLNWFGRKAPSSPEVAPSQTMPPVARAPVRPTGSPRSSPPAARPPPIRRYQYRPPAPPSAGNRAEAGRLFAAAVQAHKDAKLAQAIALYQQAASADASFFDARYNLGTVAYEVADWPLALSAYEQALIVKPDNVNARYNFALALQRADYPLDAANELEAIVTVRPDDVAAHLALGSLYAVKLGQKDRAREHYLKVLGLQPEHTQASVIRSWLLANP